MMNIAELIAARDNPERYVDCLTLALDTCESVDMALAVADVAYEAKAFDAEWTEEVSIFPPVKEATEGNNYAVDLAIESAELEQGIAELLKPVQLAHDIDNRQAQGILNRALAASNVIGKEARNRLASALDMPIASRRVEAVLKIIGDYKIQFANLLGTTQLASLLEGMREVAGKLPPLPAPGTAAPPPPSLSPQDAKRIVDRIKPLGRLDQEAAIQRLPGDHQRFIRQSLGSSGAGIPPQEPAVPRFPEGDPSQTQWPIIDEAVRELASKNVVQRQDYDLMDYAARQKAFTVASVDSNETLEKIRDALAENVRTGVDFGAFKEQVKTKGIPDTFLSDGHQETVFRTNVQGAFSEGQMSVLDHPMVQSGFPFVQWDAIADDRVRPEHLAMEKNGIAGGNIYMNADPVWQMYRPPIGYNCRCSWTPISIRQAADAGVEHAKKWLETGTEPADRPYVAMPDWEPPPGFRREGVPLSIQLSMLPINFEWAVREPIDLGTVGTEYHGPKPPGQEWVQVRTGPKGGKVWAKSSPSNQPEGQVKQPSKTEETQSAGPKSKAFKEWFGDSKVVDDKGEPLRLYHGTTTDFAEFAKDTIKSRFPYSFGFHFTSRTTEADEYAKGGNDREFTPGAQLIPVYLKAENPLVIDTKHLTASMEADLNRSEIIHKLVEAKKAGNPYDSVIIRRNRGDEWDGINVVVFEPTQIKSAIANRGTFDQSSGNINLDISWQPYTGTKGGQGWKNTATGEVRYQAEMPSEASTVHPVDSEAKAATDQAEQAPKILDSLGHAGKWLRDRTKAIYGKLEGRYGRKAALAIFASGQAISWGAAGVGAATGTPLWVPSAIAMAPGAALAEICLQAKRLSKPKPVEGAQMALETTSEGENLSPEAIEVLGGELARLLTQEWEGYNGSEDEAGAAEMALDASGHEHAEDVKFTGKGTPHESSRHAEAVANLKRLKSSDRQAMLTMTYAQIDAAVGELQHLSKDEVFKALADAYGQDYADTIKSLVKGSKQKAIAHVAMEHKERKESAEFNEPMTAELAIDKTGHEHKEKGPGGGQFAKKGGGGDSTENIVPTKAVKGKSSEQQPSEKALRAKAAHVMVDKVIQRYSEEHNEPKFAKAMGGVSFPNGEAVDVALPGDNGVVAHGIELKTMVKNANNKITMKRSAMERKAAWERKNKAPFHTVVLDDHQVFNAKGEGQHDESKRRIFYRRGYGSFRVGSMHEVKDLAELRQMMNMKEGQLPPAARRVPGQKFGRLA